MLAFVTLLLYLWLFQEDMLEPVDELRTRIQEWLASKRAQ